MKSKMSYKKFQKAIRVFDLIGLETKEDIRNEYLKLSKKYHPDMPGGNAKKFQEINRAYVLLNEYMDSFRFKFNEEEFKEQYPFIKTDSSNWSLW